VRLWRSPRRWPRGATNPVQIHWKSHVFFPLSWGRWPSIIRRNRWLWALCSAFTPADTTDALATGNIDKMRLQQWVGTNVALCCCRMNMPSAGRAKFANCNAHEDKKVISKQLSKLCVPKLRRAAQGKGNCSRMMTRSCSREGAARTECTTRTSCPTRRSCGEKELCRELSPQSVLGECEFPSHMKKLTLLGNVSPLHPLWWRC